VQTDFVALLDALRAEPAHCASMKTTFPGSDGKLPLVRRAGARAVTHIWRSAADITVCLPGFGGRGASRPLSLAGPVPATSIGRVTPGIF